MAHSHHHHREHQVSHRRVHKILEGHGAEAKAHFHGHGHSAFSKVTSKSAAEHHDGHIKGHKAPKRYAKGGRVKDGKHKGHQTNIVIVNGQHRPPQAPLPGGQTAGAPPPMLPPGGAPGPLPPGGPGGGGPPMSPPGMRARGGRTGHIDGEDSAADQKAWSKRAAGNSYFRGGAATGVGREEKAAHMKRKGK